MISPVGHRRRSEQHSGTVMTHLAETSNIESRLTWNVTITVLACLSVLLLKKYKASSCQSTHQLVVRASLAIGMAIVNPVHIARSLNEAERVIDWAELRLLCEPGGL